MGIRTRGNRSFSVLKQTQKRQLDSRERPAPPQGENAVAKRKSVTLDSRTDGTRKYAAQIVKKCSAKKRLEA